MSQIQQFRPAIAAICEEEKLPELKEAIADLDPQPILVAEAGVIEVARYGAETVVTGIVGCAGLLPTIAIEAGKDIALANKETLIAGGPVVLPLVEKHGGNYQPPEHSAIFSAPRCSICWLTADFTTASGGARDWPVMLASVSVADALKHPNWSMGQNHSRPATLMNKLKSLRSLSFGLGYDQIEIVIHLQSIIHSPIELQDTQS